MPTRVQAWKKAKTAFETTTNKSKPSPKVAGVFKTGAGIEAALKTVDETEAEAHASEKNLAKFTKAVNTFLTAKNKYLVTLENAVKTTHKGVDQATYLKGITVLRTQLAAIESSLRVALEKKKDNITSVKEIEAELLRLQAMFVAAADEADAFVSQVRARPTVEQYNSGVQAAARKFVTAVTDLKDQVHKAVQAGVMPKRTPEFEAAIKRLGQRANPGYQLKDKTSTDKVVEAARLVEYDADAVRKWATTQIGKRRS